MTEPQQLLQRFIVHLPVCRYLSLHTADPGDGGSQTDHEATYTNYKRIPIDINIVAWDAVDGAFLNKRKYQFPECGEVGGKYTYIAIGVEEAGAGRVELSGPLAKPIGVFSKVTPQVPPGAIAVPKGDDAHL